MYKIRSVTGFYRAGEYAPGRGVKRPADFLVERTVPDIADESLPKELKLLFQPLYCKLCSVQLSSNQTAIMHYKAKSHEKKIRKWLTDWAVKTGEPLPKRATAPREKKTEDLVEKNPSWFHCDVCDLDLTGQIHAESHYMGRNHQKALLGHKTPAGSGYYDKDGKWVRIKHLKSKSMDEKGEDSFGADFKKNLSASSVDAAPQQKKEVTPISNYHCKVCNIYTTHPDILESHFKGQKHAKKLKHLGIVASGESKNSAEETAIRPTTISTAIDNKTNNEVNLTAYRTPSGLYYCAICNTTINSESSFLQHLNSKGHDKKSQLKSKGTI
ncbi:hypothetical protein HUJ04_000578 [Dendroctonus ponderosae]|nr:hypothetical protein HUJ04_000578 [Dendroctonus ponderosae]